MPQSNEATIEAIKHLHRERLFVQNQRKRMDNALGAFVRIVLGWHPDLPKPESEALKKAANDLIANGEIEAVLLQEAREAKRSRIHQKTRDSFDAAMPHYVEVRAAILATIEARAPFDKIETDRTKEMERLATTLPVWPWAETVHGFGARSLATIVGDAGDLGNYPKKGHLWKRLGVAVIDGIAQGKLPKSAAAEEWIKHGYSRTKRSRLFVVGDALIKAGGDYYQIYLERKAYERAKAEAQGLTVVPAARIPKKNAAAFTSDGVMHRRAQRYMEKRLLRDLLREWKAAQRALREMPLQARCDLPAARPHLEAAE